jgi:serine protease Do
VTPGASRCRLLFLLAVGVLPSACKRLAQPNGAERSGPAELPPGAVLVTPEPSASAPEPPEHLPPPSWREAWREGQAIPGVNMPRSFAQLAKAADPGVVTIVSRVEERTRNGRKHVVQEGLGTGFVYDKGGLILTNNHVVEDGTEISAKFADSRELPAKVVGTDKPADVAVLRVDDKNLTPLPLGDSDATEVGDWVVAIGNPFGLSHTVSAGILSAKGRTHDDVKGLDKSGYFNFLQTDAAINQGNSGGPLLNLQGQVVGINSAIRANANNIGFAIPINMVKELLPILLRDGKITRSALGVVADGLNEAEAIRLKRPDRKGAWIKDVIAGGGADRAGLTPDDIVVGFDGRPIADPNQLRWLASLAGVGKTVPVRVQRGSRLFDVRVTLGPLEAAQDEEDGPSRLPRLVPP